MAKKKKQAPPRNKWQAHPNDAIRLAAFRWFALEIERVAIQIYASNQTLYEDMEHVLRDTLKSMANVGKDIADDGDCPEGYFLCRDGVCAPMCDGIIADHDED